MLPKNPTILLSNDDGIHAPGLEVLLEIAKTISDDIWIVAPETEQSAKAHSITLDKPLRLKKWSEKKYSVDGTPTDCVLVGVRKLFPNGKPDLILSGVNYGPNLGEDVTYSGTVAAAMEGTLFGVPSIALSQNLIGTEKPNWETARTYGATVVKQLLDAGWPKNVLMNVNFPNVAPEQVKGTKVVKQGFRDAATELVEWTDPRGKSYFWIGLNHIGTPNDAASDLHAILDDFITITPLHLDLTEHQYLAELDKKISGDLNEDAAHAA